MRREERDVLVMEREVRTLETALPKNAALEKLSTLFSRPKIILLQSFQMQSPTNSKNYRVLINILLLGMK